MGFFEWLSATAVSLTVAGNTGVSPFLSIFLVGCLEKANPGLLQMDDTMATLVASWPSLILGALLTALEFVGNCVPVVDEIMDSALTVVIPIVSILGSLSTFGIYSNNPLENLVDESLANNDDQEYRRLGAGSAALTVVQVTIVAIGVGLALLVHLLKMLIRLVGQGWLTGCMTILERIWCIFSIVVAVFVKPLAIVFAAVLCVGAATVIKRKYFRDSSANEQEDHEMNHVFTRATPSVQRLQAAATAATTTTTKTHSGLRTQAESNYLQIP